jgi:hypothetical protein
MSGLLERVLVDRVIVAIDPGKVLNRVWVTRGDGLLGEPVSLPTSRVGVDRLEALVAGGGSPGVRAGGNGVVASGVGGRA